MNQVRGVGACRVGPNTRVVARGPELMVVVASVVLSADPDQGVGLDLLRACPARSGRFVELGITGDYGDGRWGARELAHVAVAGERVAWALTESSGPSGGPLEEPGLTEATGLVLMTADLAAEDLARTRTILLQGSYPNLFTVAAWGELAISPGGVVAWILRLNPDQLQIRSRDGTIHTVATGAALASPGFSEDGATLTWLDAGQSRRAPLPQ